MTHRGAGRCRPAPNLTTQASALAAHGAQVASGSAEFSECQRRLLQPRYSFWNGANRANLGQTHPWRPTLVR